MNPLIALEIGIVFVAGFFAALLTVKPQPREKEKEMANKFITLLDHVGEGLKKFFESPVAADVENFGITVAEAAWPGLTPMLSAVQAAIAKAQALATAANVTGDTTAQVAALALADAQQAFNTYQQASGTTLETAQQQIIVQLVLNLLKQLPAPPSPASTAPAPASTGQVAPASSPAPAAPAPAPAAAVQPAPAVVELKPLATA